MGYNKRAGILAVSMRLNALASRRFSSVMYDTVGRNFVAKRHLFVQRKAPTILKAPSSE